MEDDENALFYGTLTSKNNPCQRFLSKFAPSWPISYNRFNPPSFN